ncbi:arginine--tRNA ligase [Candidatus Woesearchaeota archaeon]|nr:arginine--tRNA ligase [Candidatus Woesearchaeota archaeon]MBT4151047.1 arginine--tRNA ligase [Candidatus Woesearchaeota archaeon]MBT4247576.1 arginine--tRNA ligase [Candidatus Woesearchaeota archaeon]MBT4433837.1 arginine--tRNA ligase [Candidatus Woesearchaeota archaeon]MBT7332164.1 arginine--tRNA ligase [Candidatus Woesearchaeota archaeon]
MDFKQKIIELIKKNTKLKTDEISNLLSVPPNPDLGDFAFPCFKLGKNPVESANKLKDKIKIPDFLEKIETKGPYLNFYLDKANFTEKILTNIQKETKNYGKGREKKKILVEYCGPNTNKPLHLGHVRNMALGNAVVRILEFQGNKVIPVNIINDRGIHICQSMVAYQKWGKKQKPNKKGDHFVGDYYVLFSKKSKEDPNLDLEAKSLLLKWEEEDPETHKLWRKMNTWVLQGFQETYDRFGIAFEKEYFESEIYKQGKEVAFEGLKKGVFEKNDDKSITAPLEKFGMTNKVVLRGDGTSVYITQDMFLAQQRYEDYKFDKLLYVVASEQSMHFKQLFKILELLKRKFAKNLHHLSYGMVHLPTGRMKSREGTVVDADDIMDEISELAQKEVEKRYKNLSKKERKRRGEFISLAAIKFFMLRSDASKDMVFDPKASLSFEGETGPYIQYTHARANSILKKADVKITKVNYNLLQEPKEQALISLLSKFPTKVEETARHYKPHIICRYLLDLAQAFNEFYHACHVISEDKKLMEARVVLVAATKQVLANGLKVLGIHAPEEM